MIYRQACGSFVYICLLHSIDAGVSEHYIIYGYVDSLGLISLENILHLFFDI
jgi:hypothetical protein